MTSYLRLFIPPIGFIGTLDLNNSNSSPEGSTKVGMLMAIGYGYRHAKSQRSSSYRFRDMKVESSHSFQWEKSTFSKGLLESQDRFSQLKLSQLGPCPPLLILSQREALPPRADAVC